MPPKEVGPTITVIKEMKLKYKDIFDMKNLYEALYEWFKEYDWKDVYEGGEHWETLYGERIDRNGARQIWIQWRLCKEPPGAPFLKYYLDLDFQVIALTNTEVIKDGVKISTNKGEINLITSSYIEKEYEEKAKKSSFYPLFGWLIDIFNQRVYRRELKIREKELYQETYALNNFIKQWFKLKRYLPYEESKNFFPSYAWPSHLKE